MPSLQYLKDNEHVLGPSLDSRAVTKSDTDPLPGGVTRALWVGGEGDVAVRMAGTGQTVTFVGVLAGTRLDIVVDRVMAATTATNIVAMY